MCSPSAPAPPDPNTVSAAQTASNVDTARVNAALNRVNQNTPYGSLTYTQTTPASFDQAGYDKAQQEYLAKAQNYAAGTQNSGLTFDGGKLGGNNESLLKLAQAIGTGPDKAAYTNPGSDQWNAEVKLSPEQQKLLETTQGVQQGLANTGQSMIGQVQSSLGKPLDTSGFTQYGQLPGNAGGAQSFNPAAGNYISSASGGDINKVLGAAGQGIQSSLGNVTGEQSIRDTIASIMSRAQPMLDREQSALDQKLANQGITSGSAAYGTAQNLQGQRNNDAYMQAIQAGNAQQNVLFNQALQSGNFANSAQAQAYGQTSGAQQQAFNQSLSNANLNNAVEDTRYNQGLNTAQFNNAAQNQNYQQLLSNFQAGNQQRQQQLQESSFLRDLPLNELTALMSSSQVSNPQFGQVPQTNVANTNTAGNIFQSMGLANQNASNQTASNNAIMGGLFSLGAAAISDRRLKTNIERVGEYRGMGIYDFDYIFGGDRQRGLMADEVEKIAPDAVSTSRFGYKYVDYSKV